MDQRSGIPSVYVRRRPRSWSSSPCLDAMRTSGAEAGAGAGMGRVECEMPSWWCDATLQLFLPHTTVCMFKQRLSGFRRVLVWVGRRVGGWWGKRREKERSSLRTHTASRQDSSLSQTRRCKNYCEEVCQM